MVLLIGEEERVHAGLLEGVQVAAAVEGVDVSHHGTWAVDRGPIVREEFLRPAAELVAGPIVVGDLLDSVAVADPIEVGTPDVRVDNGECPSACGNLTDKGMVMGLGGGAAARGREDWLEACSG